MDFTDYDNFYKSLKDKANVAKVGASKGRHGVTLESLSQKCLFSPEESRRTVQHTTHRGIRKVLHPSLSIQFKTNDQVLRYNMLKHSIFTDRTQVGNVSRIRIWYVQVSLTHFGWSRAHLIKRTMDAHKTLSLLFKR